MNDKEKIEEAKRLYQTANADQRYVLESLFPELKESEDERIRKEIIEFVTIVSDSKSNKMEWIAWLEKQGEQKPTDKGKPKFKVGDFIVNAYCMGKVIELTNDAYLLDTGQGIPFSYEHNAHLWTVQDAKDGDVLTTTHDNGIGQITFIFKWIIDDGIYCYCLYDSEMSDKLCFDPCTESNFIGGVNGAEEEFHPATKEQHDTLMKAMADAGYTFDFEKKELIRLEKQAPKSKWSEEDEHRAEDAIYFLDTAKKHYASTDELDYCINWLKSLKQRMEEQR